MTRPTKGEQISIYAELLSNIKQVSIAVRLPSLSNSATVARVLDNGRRLFVEHDGNAETIDLPGMVVAHATLQIPQPEARDLTWRLPLSPEGPRLPMFSPENQSVPWAAMDLQAGSAVCCRSCNNVIIPEGIIHSWKDLPSENWAEMMEFWHCHKPHDHDSHGKEELANKGYGANSAITAQQGVGFVDITSFMFDEADCTDLLFSKSNSAEAASSTSETAAGSNPGKFLHIFCGKCTTEIGLFSIRIGSVTLFKWQVTCSTALPTSRAPSGPECLAATLVANISRTGCAKSVIVPHMSEKGHIILPLYLWVLNPNVIYSSSFMQGKKTAMKILFQSISEEQSNKLLDSITSDVQDLSLPAATIQSSQETLEASGHMLPEKERSFRDWQVGLLDRWESI